MRKELEFVKMLQEERFDECISLSNLIIEKGEDVFFKVPEESLDISIISYVYIKNLRNCFYDAENDLVNLESCTFYLKQYGYKISFSKCEYFLKNENYRLKVDLF